MRGESMKQRLACQIARIRPTYAPIAVGVMVVFLGLATVAADVVDLSGWWKVVEDNNHLIRFRQQGADVSVYDGDGTFLVSGVVSNDTLTVFQPPDTLIFVYAADTLRGLNENGDPITLVRYPVDLDGWWKDVSDGGVLRIQGRSTDVTVWMEDTVCVADGTFGDDTLLLSLRPPLAGTLVFVYAADTLRGQDPDGNPVALVRAPYGQWVPIRCGAITVDGDTSDWSPAHLVADDLNDDGASSPAAELDKLYLCHDSTYFYFRIDCVGNAAFPPDSNDWGARYAIRFGDYGAALWDQIIHLRNNVTGQETTLEHVGVNGHTIEGRIPLNLIGGLLGQMPVTAVSEHYDWDFGWQFYDEIENDAEQQACGAKMSGIFPEPQNIIWLNAINPVIDTLIIGNLPDRPASDLDPASILINGNAPTSASLVLQHPGFAGGVIRALFPAKPFIQEHMPVWDTMSVSYTVSGTFRDGGPFDDTGQVAIVGHRSGDVNADGRLNVADATFLVAYMFHGGAAPNPLLLADVDGSCQINVADLIYLVDFLFGDGEAPRHGCE